MKPAIKLFLIAFCSIVPTLATQAAVEIKKLDKDVAFIINDNVFTQRAVAHLLGQTKKHNPKLNQNSLVKGLIENHLIVNSDMDDFLSDAAGHDSHSKHGDDHNDHEHDHGEGGGHSEHMHEVGINVQAYAEYQQLLNTIKPIDGHVDLNKFIKADALNYKNKLQELLKKDTSRNMSNEDLDDAQVSQAQNIVVLRFDFTSGSEPHEISFWDVFSQSNVHERTRLRRMDENAIENQASKIMVRKYQEFKIASETTWTNIDLENLKQFVFDKVRKQKLLKDLGIVADLHHDTPSLKPFIAEVKESEIEEYYKSHKDEFMQVSSVKARHITVATQRDADVVYHAIKNGLDFTEAVAKYSISPDKMSNPSGSMGNIDKNSKELSFREKLALIQPVGKVSTPYRMLDGKSYELLLVDEKLPEYLALSDKSVRTSIINKLARQKAATSLERFKDRLISRAIININALHYSAEKW